jgi:predicted ATPase
MREGTTDNRQLTIRLVGRETELRHLHSQLEKALRGERQIVFITGEPGIGKTTLVDAFVEQIGAQHEVWITRGQCIEQYGAGEAYLPLLEALSRLGREAGKEEVVATLAQYAPTWLAQLPALVSLSEREGLQRTLLGATRERMLRELTEAIEVLTARRPIIIVLEDLHWSDSSTLEVVAYLAQRQGPARLLLIGTYRPAEVLASGHPLRRVVQELQVRRRGEELPLALLLKDAVAVYVDGRFGAGQLPAEFIDALCQWTGGNPLFMVSVVEHLLRERVLVEVAGQWQVKQDLTIMQGDVPDSIRQLIEKQFEGLQAEEQRVLEAGSIAGTEFAVATVAAALNQTIETVEAWCESLAAKRQFVRAAGVEEWPDGTISGRYCFLHALYQNVVYERIAEARQLRLHRCIGERKEAAYGQRTGEIAGELAVHFEAGRDYGRAVRALEQAGGNAIRRHAHQEAIRHLTRGLELLTSLPDTPERAQQELTLHVALATPLMATKGYAAPEVEHAYARAYALYPLGAHGFPTDPGTGLPSGRASVLHQEITATPQLFPVLRGLMSLHHVRAQLREGRKVGEQLLSLAQHVDDPLLHVQAHYGQGAMLFDLAELPAAVAHLERALALYHPQQHSAHVSLYGGYDPGVACLHWSAMALWMLGYPDQAQQRGSDALRLAQELAHPFSLAWAWHIMAVLHQYRRNRQATKECVRTALTLAEEHGFAFIAAMSTLSQGWGLVGQGETEAGLARMREGLAAYQATGAALTRPGYLAMFAAAHAKLGQTAEAMRFIDDAFAVIQQTGEHLHEADLYRLKGGLVLQSAVSSQQSAVKTSLERISDKSQVSRDLSGVPNPQPPVPSPQAEAEGHFQKAIEVARQQQAKSLELRATMNLCRLWQGQGKNGEARQLLEEIYSWFTEGFDTRDLQEAQALLRALGATVEPRQKKDSVEPSASERTTPLSLGTAHLRTGTNTTLWTESHGSKELDAATALTGKVSDPFPRGSNDSAPAPLDDSQISKNIFRREGEYWTLTFQGTVCRIKDIRGMQYLAQLLSHPNEEFHAIALVTGGATVLSEASTREKTCDETEELAGFTDAGEMLDPQARAAYKRRLKDLQAELEEAQEFNDLGRVEKVQEEIDFLTQELSHAIGLGGRMRKAASPTERARVNVTRALKAAMKKITESHPSLGEHLTHTVKTGTFCSYIPDPYLPLTWQC